MPAEATAPTAAPDQATVPTPAAAPAESSAAPATTTTASTVSPVHGGRSELVNRIVSELPSTENLQSIVVKDVDYTTLYRIADGTLSPITGPMNKEDYDSVLNEKVIVRDGEKYAWTIPIVLPVTTEEKKKLVKDENVGLKNEKGDIFGVMKVGDCWEWDKKGFMSGVYGTERTDHPGARLWTSDEREWIVGGEISLVEEKDDRVFKEQVMNPKNVRKLIQSKGFEQSIGFQTRNPLHRAHEYALVHGAELLLKESEGKKIGVFLNPLVGQLKGDDVPASVRMETYSRLVDGGFLGEGDVDEELWKKYNQNLKSQTVLAGLDMRMYYGGPSEAVMHSIYRQNLGLTHFIIGRKHADAPYDDKSPIWGDFDAQEIFTKLNGKLAIKTVNVGFAAYFEELGKVGLVAANKDKKSVSISGSKMRELLNSGEMPDKRVMRPCTAEVLIKYYKEKAAKSE